jgi:hypothetical protein
MEAVGSRGGRGMAFQHGIAGHQVARGGGLVDPRHRQGGLNVCRQRREHQGGRLGGEPGEGLLPGFHVDALLEKHEDRDAALSDPGELLLGG